MHRLHHGFKRGFALPTVLIASVILLTVLAFSVSATTAVRTALKTQYYTQLAQVAGEAGVAYAKACLAQNGNVPLWTDAKPLTPATDCSGNNILTSTLKALVVAGGGGGGNGNGSGWEAGGGGAGGLVYNSVITVNATTYPITVGNGGNAQQAGQNSIFSTITAIGGGAGASSPASGGAGGSGGGGSHPTTGGGAATVGQGFPGGTGASSRGGGGGGAGGAGGNTGLGGAGVLNDISGASRYYAAGGGAYIDILGGSSIGGTSTTTANGAVTSGQSNSGSGGAGGYGSSSAGGAAGGSGLVIISYPKNANITATGGNEVYESGAYKIHKFTSGGNFVVSGVGSAVCPTDPRCSVTVNGNVRSSFSVLRPALDVNGRAVTIANSGYVDILRSSTGAVWRTYKQPGVQSVAVPALCSGSTSSISGWNNVALSSSQDSIPGVSSARSITIANTNVNAGPMYFRSDFNVSSAGTYNLKVLTSSSQDIAEVYVDGVKTGTSSGSLATGSADLTSGCHSLFVKLTNVTLAPRSSRFTASLQKSDASNPVVVTDASWRVAAGAATHFSAPNYYAAPSQWGPIRDWTGNYSNAEAPGLRGITMSAAVATGFGYYRDNRTINVTDATPIRIKVGCTVGCTLYVDGSSIGNGNGSTVTTFELTLQPGDHKIAVKHQSTGGSPFFYLWANRVSDGALLSQTDLNWSTTNAWTTNQEYYSYDTNYLPTPNPLPTGLVSVLAVGGGGGGGSDMGGGGGGGGVVYNASYNVVGDLAVTVGNGGNGALAGVNQARGLNGGNSVFGTITAFGGGGGGSEYANNNNTPGSGATGGGSAGCIQNFKATGILGQGYASAGTPGCYYPTGGGGAGGVSSANPGHGGVGVQNDIMGPNYYWGGGGGGSGYTGIGGNGGNGGGGGGAVGTTTGGSGLNAGQPGGGGGTSAQVNKPGGNGGTNTGGGGGGGSHYNYNNTGGNGGSGIVVISYPTGSIKASGGTITTVGSRTVHTFYSSGTFSIIPTFATVDTLVVGGGGGGAGAGSGGGAGGYVFNPGLTVTKNTYAVVVGNGGNGGISAAVGSKGGNSLFNGIIAEGGGYGVQHNNGIPAGNGGSGGGGTLMSSGVPWAGGLGSQGNNGGLGIVDGGWVSNTGGGGGAGTPGIAASNAPGWAFGGMGLGNSITGSIAYYAGGGGGGEINGSYTGYGGLGGGGNALLNIAGTSGTANTGGGGGGGSYNGSYWNGGNGGSGIVVIRYLTGSMTATGGTITTSGPYTIHKFASSDYFTIASIALNPPTVTPVNMLVVAGGGSGGSGYQGGGGGGGGVVTASQNVGIGDYPVVVGSGGSGGSNSYANGNPSSFSAITAVGGGYGAAGPPSLLIPAQPGGSGGGGAHPTQALIGFGVVGQGNNGGLGYSASCPCVGGGGGGAGGVGQDASASKGGDGGPGTPNVISGATVYYGAGGGGSLRGGTAGVGGLGGGGNGGGANLAGLPGTPNTGSGGGAGNNSGGTSTSGSGGSGVVIISYPVGSMTATGGTITTSGGNRIHTFTSSGTFTVTSIP